MHESWPRPEAKNIITHQLMSSCLPRYQTKILEFKNCLSSTNVYYYWYQHHNRSSIYSITIYLFIYFTFIHSAILEAFMLLQATKNHMLVPEFSHKRLMKCLQSWHDSRNLVFFRENGCSDMPCIKSLQQTK